MTDLELVESMETVYLDIRGNGESVNRDTPEAIMRTAELALSYGKHPSWIVSHILGIDGKTALGMHSPLTPSAVLSIVRGMT